jgi:cellulose synthase/poly-beta-1,6-N-acetylglucosamine synthase-like glycosyltransferase
MFIIQFFFVILFVYLALGTVYLLALAIAGRWGRLPKFESNNVKSRIAVIIPSYREDAIIVETAKKAAMHQYPTSHFNVFVVADTLQPETIARLKQIPVEVLEVNVRMKSKSIHAVLQTIDATSFDVGVILDADNIMGDNCLEKINDAFQKGAAAMQCHRTAKNQQNSVALLDAISEEINVNLFRRGPSVLAISAAPIGSGMAFALPLLKKIFSTPEILNNPGEDREIDLYLMKQRIPMQFIDGAYVYDEKVADTAVFEKQRVRWLEAQLTHVKRFFQKDMKDAPKTAIYYNKFFQNLLLPRSLFILMLVVIATLLILQWILGTQFMHPSSDFWLLLMALFGMSLFFSIPSRFFNYNTLKALLTIPALIFTMMKALLKVKSNRKEFLHTPKNFKSN